MWYNTIKKYYDNKHPQYTDENLKTFVVAKMLAEAEYKEITNIIYVIEPTPA
ncbi:XkdX family protein [Paenibacillus anaericanus]|uniref:XkdX family protein n=1 Tax=Paenibacillus anaericanus TaxID=170367 RepID=A0A433Y978_9BACL|nr:XkdX family protein [Paenibacillus anaericanus]RUT46445.1 XkdX family protein [Paenibacillus anaericanus]